MKKIAMNKKRWIILIASLIVLSAVIILIIVVAIGNMFICHTGKPQSQFEGSVKQEWISSYRYGVNFWTSAQDIAVDQQGNIYVTSMGDCSNTTKFNSAGEQLWVANSSRMDIAAIAVDAQGGVYVTGLRSDNASSTELAIVKYDADGNELWITRLSNSNDSYYEQYISAALDKHGNVYVAIGSSTTRYTIKCNGSDGTELWIASHESLCRNLGAPYVVVDVLENVYVSGADEIVKYDSGGREIWTISTVEEGENCGGGCLLAIDPLENVCMASYIQRDYVFEDGTKDWQGGYRVAKYDGNGSKIWAVAHYGVPCEGCARSGSTMDLGFPRDIAVDEQGNVYIAGEFKTVKYSADGVLLWTGISGNALAIDSIGNTYVTGTDGKWCVTTKYNIDGTKVWAARYWGGLEDFWGWGSIPDGIALDVSDNVYITGTSIYKICPVLFSDRTEDDYIEYITTRYSQQ